MSEDFFKAVMAGDVTAVKEMLEADSSLASARDEQGVSAILKATYYGKKDVAAALLATGIALNIFEAAATGQRERVRALIQEDPSLVNSFAPDGFHPLGLATFFGHSSTVEALLDAGADVSAPSRESMKVTALHSAIAAGQSGIARILIAHSANVNAQCEGGLTPLQEAAANGDRDLTELLLAYGADINARATDGKTAVDFALERGQTELAALLRERAAKR
jgi:ankyrin repeat protein